MIFWDPWFKNRPVGRELKFCSGTGGLDFNPRIVQIPLNITNGLPPLRHCVVEL